MIPSSSLSSGKSPAEFFWASSACDSRVTLGLGGGESLDFGGKGDARRDGGLESGLEVGVLIVGVGVLEGYLAAEVPIEASNFPSVGIQADRMAAGLKMVRWDSGSVGLGMGDH